MITFMYDAAQPNDVVGFLEAYHAAGLTDEMHIAKYGSTFTSANTKYKPIVRKYVGDKCVKEVEIINSDFASAVN